MGQISDSFPQAYINLPIIYRSIDLKFFVNMISILIWLLIVRKTIKIFTYYRSNKINNYNKKINNNLIYLITTLKLYDEEVFEVKTTNRYGEPKIEKEKRIVRTIRILYKEDSNKVYVRILKLGDRFTSIASTLSENIESTLGLEIDTVNSTVNYYEYVLLKKRDKRINLEQSIYSNNSNSFRNLFYGTN